MVWFIVSDALDPGSATFLNLESYLMAAASYMHQSVLKKQFTLYVIINGTHLFEGADHFNNSSIIINNDLTRLDTDNIYIQRFINVHL